MLLSQAILDQLSDFFKKQPEVLVTYFYGSRISGQALPKSDLDLAIVVKSQDSLKYRDIYLELNQIIKDLEVDVRIITADTPPNFIFQVLKNSQLIYQKDPLKKVEFEARALRDYYDSQHIRDIYDSYLKQSFT